MVSLRGILQKEGEVIHVIVEKVTDHTALLDAVGALSFPHRPGRGDGATHPGSPDRGDPGWQPKPKEGYYPPFDGGADPEDVVRVKTRDFR